MLVPGNFPDRSVCILGLGYVGLTLAVAMAEAGFDVIGVEIRDDVVESLRAGVAHFLEPKLDDKLRRMIDAERLHISGELPRDAAPAVYIITVGTPLDGEGRVRTDMIESVAREVAARLREGDLVVLRSTVKVGSTRHIVAPILNGVGVRYDLAFCPERTLEGNALEELGRLPQIVGGRDMQSGMRAGQIFQFLTPTVVRVDDLETAEMIKLVDNTQRDVLFAFSNEIAHLCEALGVSAAAVIHAGKLGYPRTNLALPGPVGGPCLEKDPHILTEAAREAQVEPRLTVAARHTNEELPARCVAQMARVFETAHRKVQRVALLGLAFKGRPATNDLRGTMARPILQALNLHFPAAQCVGYDALVAAEEVEKLGLEWVSTLEGAFRDADLVVVANNHPVFASMPLVELAGAMKGHGLVYDFWNHHDPADLELPGGVRYMTLGSPHLSGVGLGWRATA